MRLFNSKKSGKEGNNIIPSENSSMYDGYDVYGNKYTLTNVMEIKKFSHSDGHITSGLMALIVKPSPSGRINLGDGNYISFELSQNISHTNALYQRLIEEYGKANRNGICGINQTYLGEFKEVEPEQFAVINRSDFVKEYMDNVAIQMIEQRRIFLDERNAINRAIVQQKDFEKRVQIDNDAKQKLIRNQQDKANRIAHPTFEKQFETVSNFECYKGVNLLNGDNLFLENVQKHGKDPKGTYLYTAFLHSSHHSYIRILEDGNPEGKPIAFETDLRLEDIAKNGDVNQIHQILSLLSCNTRQLSDSELAYIGKLCRDGSVIRAENPQSVQIDSKFTELKEQFKNILKNREDKTNIQ